MRLGIGLGLTFPRFAGGGGAPATPGFDTHVVDGDSNTRGGNADTASWTTTEPTDSANSFAYRWRATRPDQTVYVRAQNSRVTGALANLDDGGNSAFGHLTESLTYDASVDLYGGMWGANDLGANDDAFDYVAQYETRLAALEAKSKDIKPTIKVWWSPPPPYRSHPTNDRHPSYDRFTARRTGRLAAWRDPAVWGQWCDHFWPGGYHPDFSKGADSSTLYSDTIHFGTTGHDRLFASFDAFMDTLTDASRLNSTQMYNEAWRASENSLAAGETITRQFVVSGLAHTGIALTGGNALSITGPGSPVIRAGDGAFAASQTGWLYNGDVVEYQVALAATASTARSFDITVGSETRTLTYTTVAAVTPATYSHGGFAQQTGGHVVPGVVFPADGTGLILVQCGGNNAGRIPTSVTWNGVAATLIQSLLTYPALALYRLPVTAGTSSSVTVAYAGAVDDTVIAWGTMLDADAVPVASNINNIGIDVAPSYPTTSVTVPANGLALAFMGDSAGSPAALPTVTTGTQVSSNAGGAVNGVQQVITIGKRTTTGNIVFNSSKFSGKIVAMVVFKAAGT